MGTMAPCGAVSLTVSKVAAEWLNVPPWPKVNNFQNFHVFMSSAAIFFGKFSYIAPMPLATPRLWRQRHGYQAQHVREVLLKVFPDPLRHDG